MVLQTFDILKEVDTPTTRSPTTSIRIPTTMTMPGREGGELQGCTIYTSDAQVVERTLRDAQDLDSL